MTRSANDVPLSPDVPVTEAEDLPTLAELETPQLNAITGIIGDAAVQLFLRQVHALFPLSSVRANREDLEMLADGILRKLRTHFPDNGEQASRFAQDMLNDMIRQTLPTRCGPTVH